ncbi:MAG: DUF3108 domain-containing protein [Candidatus Omnitrophota bacterium]|nr:DUF3108 domain-containing protein [Candidatus Omnitrophota bacterium]MDZ4241315.1 DUF3108 domain-containing protein [Candidatus Omnitrophota bacterium]
MSLAVAFSSVAPLPAEETVFFSGETIRYSIKKVGVKAGEATLTFLGAKEVSGQKVLEIVFKAKAGNLYDGEERIFVDPVTYRPVQVHRDLHVFGKKEKILEFYDKETGRVRIVKTAGGKTTEQVIEKEQPLDNLYGFIYRYRREGRFDPEEKIAMNLPTTDVLIQLKEKVQIKAGGQVYQAYHMQSDPQKYRVWFDAGPQRIPLRIDGAVGFGNTVMIMNQYEPAGAGNL